MRIGLVTKPELTASSDTLRSLDVWLRDAQRKHAKADDRECEQRTNAHKFPDKAEASVLPEPRPSGPSTSGWSVLAIE